MKCRLLLWKIRDRLLNKAELVRGEYIIDTAEARKALGFFTYTDVDGVVRSFFPRCKQVGILNLMEKQQLIRQRMGKIYIVS